MADGDSTRGLLPEPRTPLAALLRALAENAMSVTHHDASETDPEYRHEVQDMERRFRPLILVYMASRKRTAGKRPNRDR